MLLSTRSSVACFWGYIRTYVFHQIASMAQWTTKRRVNVIESVCNSKITHLSVKVLAYVRQTLLLYCTCCRKRKWQLTTVNKSTHLGVFFYKLIPIFNSKCKWCVKLVPYKYLETLRIRYQYQIVNKVGRFVWQITYFSNFSIKFWFYKIY